MTRFALLFSLLAVGGLGPVACDDDDAAMAETEVITAEFGQDLPEAGRVVVPGGADACGAYRKGPGATIVRIEVLRGVVRCREARRVLKNYYPQGRSTPPWSCVDYGDELVQCTQPGAAFRGILDCRVARPTDIRPPCPGFPSGGDLPAREFCGHFRIAPPGNYPLILVEVVKGKVPCRVARRVMKTQYRNGDPGDIIAAARPWRCAGPEGLAVCHKDPGPHHKVIRARIP